MTLSVARLRLYWDTLRHLKPVQFYGRLWFRYARPSVNAGPPPSVRSQAQDVWRTAARRRPSLLAPSLFRFLNETRSLDDGGWEDAGASKLWLYNLHYFDDLNATDADARADWHDVLIERWIAENPPGRGTGWEPYPTSLRIVNWIKRARAGRPLSDAAVHSLAIQTRWLSKRLEHHLLGNHLFANAKALVFAGCFFEGPEADAWLSRGLGILEREIPEQILPDGGHFELSTMYHALALEDLLDLANILRSSHRGVPAGWQKRIAAMRDWLSVMTHPDREIAFFNDAAIGVAPSPPELEAYALQLDLPRMAEEFLGQRWLRDSGYVRLSAGPANAILDVARVGPDYLPGHAHADTLSFELSLGDRRVIVNTGTSVYGDDPERLRQRGTAAHSTVVIDGGNSSEVWSGFRVARRARPKSLRVMPGEVECSHDGYRWTPGAPRHTRRWQLGEAGLTVADAIRSAHTLAEAMFHFHPDFTPAIADDGGETSGLRSPDGTVLAWRVRRGRARLEPSTWHPEFGVAIASQRLVVELERGESLVEFSWIVD